MKKLNTLFAATLLVAAFSAHAAPAYTPAPNQVKQVKTQAPGYFRQMVGDFEVTALYDGFLSTDPKLFQPYSQRSLDDLNKILNNNFRLREADGGVDIMGKNAGRLVDSLKAAGYRPE